MPDMQTIDYYDRNAPEYARMSRSHALDSAISDFATLLRSGSSVLDLGCGAGRDLAEFRKRGFLAVGLDASRALSSIATRASRCPVVVGDMQRQPFVDDSFDGVWASASLLHGRRTDVPFILAEVARVLNPGGVFFSSLKRGKGEGRDVHGRHFTYMEQDPWLTALGNAGFTDVRVVPDGDFQQGDAKWLRTLSRLPA